MERDVEFECLHASAGGKHAALQDVVKLLSERAGRWFASGSDTEARVARDLAREVESLREQASKELQGFIQQRYALRGQIADHT